MAKQPVRLVISPRVNESGRHEAESLVTPHKLQGGKRKGKSMKKAVKGSKRGTVTLDNLKTARDNGGIYDPKRRCVVYYREA